MKKRVFHRRLLQGEADGFARLRLYSNQVVRRLGNVSSVPAWLCDSHTYFWFFLFFLETLADNLQTNEKGFNISGSQDKINAWKDIWSAGQGVGFSKEIQSLEEIAIALEKEWKILK